MKAESNLEKILTKGEFAVTCEIGPPKGADADIVRKKAQILKGYTDAVNITDNQTAIVRMSSIVSAIILLPEGLEPIVQITARDRNRLAIQSDVLGASSLGVKNFLCLSGDHQKFGNEPKAKGVYDIDSIQMINMLKIMRDEKKLLGGDNLTKEPRIFIGAAENPYADPYEFRIIRLQKKIDAGCDFIQTQAIYDVEKFKNWMGEITDLGLDKQVYILAGVIPIKSAGMARYMRDYVAGVYVPDSIVKRMEDAKQPKEEGVNIIVEIIEELKEIKGVRGVHIMAVAWEEVVPEIVKKVKLYPRPII